MQGSFLSTIGILRGLGYIDFTILLSNSNEKLSRQGVKDFSNKLIIFSLISSLSYTNTEYPFPLSATYFTRYSEHPDPIPIVCNLVFFKDFFTSPMICSGWYMSPSVSKYTILGKFYYFF